MRDDPGRAGYSIASVSKLTGVSCHALRVWERRYGFPVPRRSPSGHRRYGDDQVRVLRRIAERLGLGEPIGAVIEQLRAGEFGEIAGPVDQQASPSCPSPAFELVDRLCEADLVGAEALYREQAGRLSIPEVLSQVLEPALTEAGERWFRKEAEIYQERCITGYLRRKLNELYDSAQKSNVSPRRTAVIGTVQGDRHEGGVIIACILLELAGWKTIYLGTDLPVREFQKAITQWSPDALGLSFVLSRNINKRFRELATIRDVPVFVGGRSVLNYQGLARSHGLIPLCGSASNAIAQMLAHTEPPANSSPSRP